ncbi:MAG: hypothetical protein AMXMBFR84_19850 [Candidatus Hydrogenedentota bacterium]
MHRVEAEIVGDDAEPVVGFGEPVDGKARIDAQFDVHGYFTFRSFGGFCLRDLSGRDRTILAAFCTKVLKAL